MSNCYYNKVFCYDDGWWMTNFSRALTPNRSLGLTSWYVDQSKLVTKLSKNDIMSRCNSCQTTPNPVNLGSISSAETLATNLQDHGWSPIFVDLQNSPPSREEILSLFQSSYLKDHSRYIYRSEESGAEGETSVEPKESIEVRLRGIHSDPETMIEKWCISLSEIAHRVCEYLDLPPDTMLAPRNYPETLDLMRVFHYYGTTDRELGSSPHTDWGRCVKGIMI